MSFKDLDIQTTYNTDDKSYNPARNFYNPVLAESKVYKRVAGYFSSSSFAFIGKGLETFIKNGGHMKFIFNVQLMEDDYMNIRLGIESPNSIFESRFLNDLSKIEDECISNHAKVLGWLIANKYLEIKIGYVDNEDNLEVGIDPILHQKSGIMEDGSGNVIAFNGSNNESATGWVYNTEYLTVFCSWKSGHSDFIKDISSTFEKFWKDEGNRTRVISFPEAVEQKLISIAPKTEFDLFNLLKNIVGSDDLDNSDENRSKEPIIEYKKKDSQTIELREYQKLAIEAWKNNNCCGLFEMATGTGKTITAVSAYSDILEKEEHLILLVTCPYAHLPVQWEKTIKKMCSPFTIFFRADGNTPQWDEKIYAKALTSFSNKRNNIVILATNDSACSNKFRVMFDKIQALCNYTWMIICDEVHSIGSSTNLKALYPEYKYRLGLSATPDRYFDEEGSETIREYFSGTVYKFTLREAIDTINPATGVSYLVPYEYVVKFASLNNSEAEEYLNWTKKIIRLKSYIDTHGGTAKNIEDLNNYYIKRMGIIKNAQNKMDVLEEIIRDLLDRKELDHLLIYCSDTNPEQLKGVDKLINSISREKKQLIKPRKYTSDESSRILKKTGESERDKILSDFDKGDFDILLAMKCLDEGVDVPSTKTAILMCSSGNSKEYIQRRGRILRPFKNKEKAILYDICVLPPVNMAGEYSESLEDIINKEKKRMIEFAKDSLNNPDIELLIENYQNKLKTGKK